MLENEISWFANDDELEPSEEWITKDDDGSDNTFCADMAKRVLQSGSLLDGLSELSYAEARGKTNKYELLVSRIFQNRSGTKMANIDGEFDFCFTSPKKPSGESFVEEDELLSFADICGGPGGFSEYVLWRSQGMCKGFGITLKGGIEDFQLKKFHKWSEMFEPYYGPNGLDSDGDIYKDTNRLAFRDFILSHTDDKGVHFAMADGAFDVTGNEDKKEVFYQRIMLCQLLLALMVLREGGHFVTNFFNIFTTFNIGLLYLMSSCFEKFSILKPITCRPANTERFIVFMTKKSSDQCSSIIDHLRKVNLEMEDVEEGAIKSIVPLKTLPKSQSFYDYIFRSNEAIANLQVEAMESIKDYIVKFRKRAVGRDIDQYFQRWGVPRDNYHEPTQGNVQKVYQHLIKDFKVGPFLDKFQSSRDKVLLISVNANETSDLRDRHTSRIIYKARMENYQNPRWTIVTETNVRLTEKTVFVIGIDSEGNLPDLIPVHDVLALCGKPMVELSREQRMKTLKPFLKALQMESLEDMKKFEFAM